MDGDEKTAIDFNEKEAFDRGSEKQELTIHPE